MENLELFKGLIEKAKKDKSVLNFLKQSAVNAQLFELGAMIREIETTYFPTTDEQKQAREKGKEIHGLFRLVEMDVREDICWLLNETLALHRKKKGKFSLKDGAELVAKGKDLFQ